ERVLAVPQHASMKTIGPEVRLDRLGGLVAVDEDEPESHGPGGRAALHALELRQISRSNRAVAAREHEHRGSELARGERLHPTTRKIAHAKLARRAATPCWRDTR